MYYIQIFRGVLNSQLLELIYWMKVRTLYYRNIRSMFFTNPFLTRQLIVAIVRVVAYRTSEVMTAFLFDNLLQLLLFRRFAIIHRRGTALPNRVFRTFKRKIFFTIFDYIPQFSCVYFQTTEWVNHFLKNTLILEVIYPGEQRFPGRVTS